MRVKHTPILLTIAKLDWQPFDNLDWNCFAGCRTENPMIAHDDDATYVIDGASLSIYTEDGEEEVFELLAGYC